jgi:hypothetical protein
MPWQRAASAYCLAPSRCGFAANPVGTMPADFVIEHKSVVHSVNVYYMQARHRGRIAFQASIHHVAAIVCHAAFSIIQCTLNFRQNLMNMQLAYCSTYHHTMSFVLPPT